MLGIAHTQAVVPYLCVKDAGEAVAFWEKAFGAREDYRLEAEGQIVHLEFRIGEQQFMVADEMEGVPAKAPASVGASTVAFMLEVDDEQAAFEQAVAAGATVEAPLSFQFYGAWTATVVDPFGFRWMMNRTVEELSAEEVQERYARWARGEGDPSWASM